MQPDGAVTNELIQFLRSHTVAAIATIKDGNIPHAATVYYYVDNDLRLYFLTKDRSVKFISLKDSGAISLAITDAVAGESVQIDGHAREVDYSGDYAPVVKAFIDSLEKKGIPWEQIPYNHMISGYYVFIQVTPIWIRWSEFRNWANTIKFEQKFTPQATAQP